MEKRIKILMLDAMGVIYKHGDDVEELLIPFIVKKNSKISKESIVTSYGTASLGRISAEEFWKNVGLSSDYEDEYLDGFRLNDEIIEFLDNARNYFKDIICLSNDVSEWSKKLKDNFGLTEYIKKWFISGDLKCRKPSPEIYIKVLDDLKDTNPGEILFIDDNIDNTAAAEKLGFKTLLLSDNYNESKNSINKLDFKEVLKFISLE